MLPFIVVGAAIFGAFSGAKTVGKVATGIKVATNERLVREAKRNFDLGFNPVRDRVAAEKILQSLGIPPEAIGMAEELVHITIEAQYIPGQEHRAGEYILLESEYYSFLDGLRHEGLQMGIGPDADRVRELCAKHGVRYEDLAFLWEGHGCDFAELRRVSEARRRDPLVCRMLGIEPLAA